MMRAWAAVHGTRVGAVLLLVTAVLAATAGGTAVQVFWGAELPSAVPMMALLPVLAATAIAAAATNRTAAATDRVGGYRRLVVARAIWLHMWLVLGTVTLAAGALVHPGHVWQVDLVNLLLYGGLALLVVSAGVPTFAWLPPALLVLVAMLLGADSSTRELRWWAASLAAELTPGRTALAGGVWVCAALLYTARGGYERGT